MLIDINEGKIKLGMKKNLKIDILSEINLLSGYLFVVQCLGRLGRIMKLNSKWKCLCYS